MSRSSGRQDFVAEHRGGPLTKENHRRLIRWARECSEHVLPLAGQKPDDRITCALEIARLWEEGLVPTGTAMKASLAAHAAAREAGDPVHIAVARSVGQAVATAHMADHCLGAAFYALKAVRLASLNVEEEKAWQLLKMQEMPATLRIIVRNLWLIKELDR